MALRECPFCGSTENSPIESIVQLCHNERHPEFNPEGDWWTVQCDNCTATMGQFPSPEEAITAWNTRPEAVTDELAEALTEAKQTLSYYLRELGSDYIRNTIVTIDAALSKVSPLIVGPK